MCAASLYGLGFELCKSEESWLSIGTGKRASEETSKHKLLLSALGCGCDTLGSCSDFSPQR